MGSQDPAKAIAKLKRALNKITDLDPDWRVEAWYMGYSLKADTEGGLSIGMNYSCHTQDVTPGGCIGLSGLYAFVWIRQDQGDSKDPFVYFDGRYCKHDQREADCYDLVEQYVSKIAKPIIEERERQKRERRQRDAADAKEKLREFWGEDF